MRCNSGQLCQKVRLASFKKIHDKRVHLFVQKNTYDLYIVFFFFFFLLHHQCIRPGITNSFVAYATTNTEESSVWRSRATYFLDLTTVLQATAPPRYIEQTVYWVSTNDGKNIFLKTFVLSTNLILSILSIFELYNLSTNLFSNVGIIHTVNICNNTAYTPFEVNYL